MINYLASRIMRTTIDIDDPILKELKRLQQRERKSLGRLVSDLLAQALASSRNRTSGVSKFAWIAKSMGARVDLADKHAVLDAMDGQAR
jgi:metal-responsive CopG/Arc/MetJ family transcriptional regulator